MKFQLPGANQRAVFVGKTGCGKTTLAQRILRYYPHVVVLDIKGEMTPGSWPGFSIYQEFDKLIKAGRDDQKRIYQPNIYEQTDEQYENFCKWVYLRKNTCLYVDEVFGLCEHSQSIPFHYKGILTRGRQRGIACLQATQSPMNVPHSILSQSELYYVFFCKMPQDRDKIFKITGIPVDNQKQLQDFEFLLASDRDYSLQRRKLKL